MTANPEDKDWQTIERWMEDPTFVHWAKKINHDDIRRWENYLNLHPHQWELAKVARSLILGIRFEPIPPQTDQRQKALSSLMKRIETQDEIDQSHTRNLRDPKRLGMILAASLAICLISGIIYWQFFFNPQVILVTAYGEQLETELPDGSLVTLNANSKLMQGKCSCGNKIPGIF